MSGCLEIIICCWPELVFSASEVAVAAWGALQVFYAYAFAFVLLACTHNVQHMYADFAAVGLEHINW